jgi:hypothetical protein
MQRKHRPFGRQSQLPSGTLPTMLGESDFSISRLTRRRQSASGGSALLERRRRGAYASPRGVLWWREGDDAGMSVVVPVFVQMRTAPPGYGAPRPGQSLRKSGLLISLGGINTHNHPHHSSFSGDSRDRRIPCAGRYDRGTRHRHRREVVYCLGLLLYYRG